MHHGRLERKVQWESEQERLARLELHSWPGESDRGQRELNTEIFN